MSERTPLSHLTAEPRELVNTLVAASITGLTTRDELLAALAEERSRAGTQQVLLTLDDVAQCSYTNRHALEDDRLYVEEPDDFDDEDPAHERAWELNLVARVASQLRSPELRRHWDELVGERDEEEDGVDALVRANSDLSAVLDAEVQVLHVDVEADDEVIAGLANGYFTSDFDVFANHAVVRRMAERHGYRHFGIGASWLGFERDEALDVVGAAAVVEDLTHLCGEHPGWDAVAAALLGQRCLFVPYTEGYPEGFAG